MTFTYVPGRGDLDMVRLLVPDVDEQQPVFTDEEIAAFLTLESSDVRLATALALETIASSHARILRVTRIMDLSVDGVAAAKELRARAQGLRDEVAALSGEAFDIAEQVFTPAGYDLALRNAALRGVL